MNMMSSIEPPDFLGDIRAAFSAPPSPEAKIAAALSHMIQIANQVAFEIDRDCPVAAAQLRQQAGLGSVALNGAA